MNTNHKFNIGFQNKISNFCLYMVIILIIIHLIGVLSHFYFGTGIKSLYLKIVSLDREYTVPTFYQFLALGFSGVLLGAIASIKKKLKDPYYLNWLIMSIIFLYLGIDEIARLHERFGKLVRLFITPTDYFSFAWVIVGIPLVILFVMLNLKFLASLKAKVRNRFIFAGFLYVLGAIVFEMIGANHSANGGSDDNIYCLYATIEESLEMLGIVFFIDALLNYLKSEAKHIDITYSNFVQKVTDFVLSREEESIAIS